MATTVTISQKEMERVAGLAYEGLGVRVSLANDIGQTLTAESTVAACDALKVSGGGYADFTTTIGTGAYNATTGRYELPQIDATFTASGGTFSYTTVYVVLGSELYLHSLTVESPNIAVADGQTQTYQITLATDD